MSAILLRKGFDSEPVYIEKCLKTIDEENSNEENPIKNILKKILIKNLMKNIKSKTKFSVF